MGCVLLTAAIKKLLVMTSGGDAPGMNAALRAVVRSGLYHGLSVFGCPLGYCGLLEKRIFPMTQASVANCIQRGGTLLQTARCLDFHEKSVREKALTFLKSQKIDALVVIGGDGSFRGATLLAQESHLKVMGVPSTIDNDIVGTDYTIGFDTARNTALEAIDKIRDTASSHNRNFLVEVMGRRAGFLAVDVGLAGGAEFILIPEVNIPLPALLERIAAPRHRKKQGSIIVVAEGENPGHSVKLAHVIKGKLDVEYRVCVLGHTQRGGSPTAYDRQAASVMGDLAVCSLLRGLSKKMIARQNMQYMAVDMPDPALGARQFTHHGLLKLNAILCDVAGLT